MSTEEKHQPKNEPSELANPAGYPRTKALSICKAYKEMAKRQWYQARSERHHNKDYPSERIITNLKTDYDQSCEAVRWLESLDNAEHKRG